MFKAVMPKDSNGWWYVIDSEGRDICTVYRTDEAEERAKMIANALNKDTAPPKEKGEE